jgi:hypothetical protein
MLFRWMMFWMSLFFLLSVTRNLSVTDTILFSVFVVLVNIFGVLLSILGKMEKK